jgi:hypothetical protein
MCILAVRAECLVAELRTKFRKAFVKRAFDGALTAGQEANRPVGAEDQTILAEELPSMTGNRRLAAQSDSRPHLMKFYAEVARQHRPWSRDAIGQLTRKVRRYGGHPAGCLAAVPGSTRVRSCAGRGSIAILRIRGVRGDGLETELRM